MTNTLIAAALAGGGIPLAPGSTIHALGGTAAVVTVFIGVAEFDSDGNVSVRLVQGILGTADAVLYTAPAGKSAIIFQIILSNTSGVDVTGVKIGFYGTAATAANQIISSLTVPLNGTAILANGVLRVQNAAGTLI